jgi:hypothetical protein
MIQTSLWDGGQRWRDQETSWRPKDDVNIDTRHFEIAAIEGEGSDTICRAFVAQHHYLKTLPAARFRYGLYDLRTDELVGVAVYSVAGSKHVARYNFPWLDRLEVVTLGRLVLLDYVPRRGESWLVGEAHRRLYHDHGIKGVVSFSDPLPRRNESGIQTTPGHVGYVYQATNALYAGRSKGENKRLYRDDATDAVGRGLSKVRARARGETDTKKTQSWESVVRELVAHGAPEPTKRQLRGDALLLWLNQALAQTAVQYYHPGQHRFKWGLDRREKKALWKHHGVKKGDPFWKNYPKTKEQEVVAA